METMTVKMEMGRVTKNTIRYEEAGDGPVVIGTVYIQKWALGNPPPQAVTITIETGGK